MASIRHAFLLMWRELVERVVKVQVFLLCVIADITIEGWWGGTVEGRKLENGMSSDAKARLSLKAPAWARLSRARAYKIRSPGCEPLKAPGHGSPGPVGCPQANISLVI